MQIVVLANDEQKDELLLKRQTGNVQFEYVNSITNLADFKNADAFFLLQDELNIYEIEHFHQPVFINSVIATLADLKLAKNVSRINAWPTFLRRDLWEVATNNEDLVKDVFEKAEWKYHITPDEPGLIAARIIAMIINEAYFAFAQKVSSKEEIDIAMKLGTNYPYGPFEWAQKVGLSKIYDLLNALHKNYGSRYTVASAIKEELKDLNYKLF